MFIGKFMSYSDRLRRIHITFLEIIKTHNTIVAHVKHYNIYYKRTNYLCFQEI